MDVGRAARVAIAGLLAPALAGCDLLLVSPTLPGLLPGIGQPLRGQVLDSATGQPIGAATVVSDIGWATTDNTGHFSLYGSVSRHSISVCRAGYTSLTYDVGPVQDDRAYFLDPLFPSSGELSSRRVEIKGSVVGPVQGVPVTAGEMVFAGVKSGIIRDGTYAFADQVLALPGSVFSGVIAGGEITGGPILPDGKDSLKAFRFNEYGNGLVAFGFGYFDVPFGPTGSLSPPQWTASPSIRIGTFGARASISYTNTAWASDVKTEITLDFGILGSVPVARGFSSHQTVVVPSVAKSTYVLEGRAYSADRKRESLVIITNDSVSNGQFDLLSPPEPSSPAHGAKGVGALPTFEWKPVTGADAYMVRVFEEGIHKPKWSGLTDKTSLPYPRIGDGDVNGGALLPGLRYTWEIRALASRYGAVTPRTLDFGDFLPASYFASPVRVRTPADILGLKDGGPVMKPYRRKTFESRTADMEFQR